MIITEPLIQSNKADLKGQVAVITGGDGGVAGGIKEVFKSLNAKVYTPLRSELDVTSDMSPWIDSIYSKGEQINIWVNAAGVIFPDPIPESTMKDWQLTMDVNLFGPLRSMQALWKYWVKDGGNLINISSTSGLRGRAKWSSYSASKAALNSLTQAFAEESKDYGIKTYALCIGRTKSNMRARLFPGEDPNDLMDPTDIGDICARLLNPENGISSGELLMIRKS